MRILTRVKKKLVRVLKKPPPTSASLPLASSLADAESLTMPPVQVIVLRADMGCIGCQKRVADFISRLDETTSMVVDVLEKKVTLTGRGPVVKRFNKPLLAPSCNLIEFNVTNSINDCTNYRGKELSL